MGASGLVLIRLIEVTFLRGVLRVCGNELMRMLPFGYDGFMTRDSSLTPHSSTAATAHARRSTLSPHHHLPGNPFDSSLHPTPITLVFHHHLNNPSHSGPLDIAARPPNLYPTRSRQVNPQPELLTPDHQGARLSQRTGQPTWPPSSQSPHSCGTRFTIGHPSRLQVVSTDCSWEQPVAHGAYPGPARGRGRNRT